MSDLLDRAVAKVRELPLEQQDVIASWLMQWADDDLQPVELTPEEERSLAPSLDQAARGHFVSHESMRKLWAKYGL